MLDGEVREEADRLQADRTLEELSYFWTDPCPYDAAARAIERLIPGSTVFFYKWAGDGFKKVEQLGASNDFNCEKSRWIQSGDAPDNHFGFGPYGEAILCQGDDCLARLAFGREKGSPAYSDEELARIQKLIPLINESVCAKRTLETRELISGNVVIVVEAIDEPAFIATASGIVIHANKKALAAYPRYPGWMKACCSERKGVECPAWVKRVPVRIGELSLWLVLPERLDSRHELVSAAMGI